MKRNKPKIALVGPTYPYRGGIAQYNTQLHRILSSSYGILTISFRKLYPKFLYPGASDTEKGALGKNELGVEYLIHVFRPWSLIKTAKQIEKAHVDVVFLTWWTLFWQPGFAYMAWLLRRKGIKVIYICHNVFDHDSKGFKKNVSKLLLKYADGYVVHSTGDAETLTKYYSKPILDTKVLPVYDQYPVLKEQSEKRGRLELLFFGFIRPYKGLEDLVNALSSLNDADVYLTIVGEPWISPKDLTSQIQTMNAPNVEAHLYYVDDNEAAFYFSRADVVVLPYKSDTASAVASLAYNYKKPILGTKVKGIRDIVKDGRTGWLVEPNSPESLAAKIAGITRKESKGMVSNIEKFNKEHNWDSMAKQILDFAQSINN